MPPTPKTTTALGTKTLTFEIIDMRGRRGFPDDHRGLVYVRREEWELPEQHTGTPKRQRRTWAVRHGAAEGAWRVDLHSGFGLWEVGVWGAWKTPEAAAVALEQRLAAQVSWEG